MFYVYCHDPSVAIVLRMAWHSGGPEGIDSRQWLLVLTFIDSDKFLLRVLSAVFNASI